MKILGIVGTTFGSKTNITLNTIGFSNDVSYSVINLANYNLEFADGRALNEYNSDVNKIIEEISQTDALVIGMPIYQASLPGSLKNLFDLFPVDLIRNKPVGVVTTSGSNNHYLVPQYQLIPILDYLKADVINKYVFISQSDFGNNEIVNDEIIMRLEILSSELEKRTKNNIERLKMFDF